MTRLSEIERFGQVGVGGEVAQRKEGLEVLKLGQRPDKDKAEARVPSQTDATVLARVFTPDQKG